MECEDRVTAWLSSQDQQDNTKSSIEIMMEEARTGTAFTCYQSLKIGTPKTNVVIVLKMD